MAAGCLWTRFGTVITVQFGMSIARTTQISVYHVRSALSDIRGRGVFCYFWVGFMRCLHISNCLFAALVFYRCHHEVLFVSHDDHGTVDRLLVYSHIV